MEAIRTENLCKKYKDTEAVKNLNLSVKKGELFALLGVNGAGKTTTVKMLTGLIQPSVGDAFLNGISIVSHPKQVKRFLALSPQENAVAPNLSIKENLEFTAGLYGFSKPEAKSRTEIIINRFSFRKIQNKKARKLSGGWQRRLSIAMALVCNPEILFLDEPTLGLDVLARSELTEIIKSLKGKITIVLTTHYMEEAEKLADRIAIMKNGEIISIGTVKEIIQSTGTHTLEEAFIALEKTPGKAC